MAMAASRSPAVCSTSRTKQGHRHAVPMALSAAPHFADRNVTAVHAGDRADEAGVADVDEGNFAGRLADDQHGVVLQLPIDGIVEHSAVIERAVVWWPNSSRRNRCNGTARE